MENIDPFTTSHAEQRHIPDSHAHMSVAVDILTDAVDRARADGDEVLASHLDHAREIVVEAAIGGPRADGGE